MDSVHKDVESTYQVREDPSVERAAWNFCQKVLPTRIVQTSNAFEV